MQKIISLFQRNYEGDTLVRDELVPGAEWVPEGLGVATRKFDGMCCMIEAGIFYKRYDCKEGRTPPRGFIPAQEADPKSKHWPGWLMVEPMAAENIWFMEAFRQPDAPRENGTYELCGPAINLNREKFDRHVLIRHGAEQLTAPRTFDELKEWFVGLDIEGIVWHHQDGRMVKIKKKDFGIDR